MAEKDKDKLTEEQRTGKRQAGERPVAGSPGEPSPDADAATAAAHQRAHDEGREAEFHAAAKADEAGEPEAKPELPTEGKLAETVPNTTAPSADELRAMGREVKPQVEPTDVPTSRYPDKVELIGGKPLTLDHEGKRDPRALYDAAKQGPMRLSKAEYEAMLAADSGLEDWERADARAMLRKGDLMFHEKER